MYIEQAAAKINLTLQIIGKQPNAMHRLESLVVFANLTDRLEIVPSDESQNDLHLALHGPYGAPLTNILADAKDNLIIQAAYALREAAGISCGAALQLQKKHTHYEWAWWWVSRCGGGVAPA